VTCDSDPDSGQCVSTSFHLRGYKSWDRIRADAEANDCGPHMLQFLTAARKAKLRVFYSMHHRYRPGDSRPGSTLRPFRRRLGCERPSSTALGVASSGPSSHPSQAIFPSAHRHRPDSTYLRRSDCPVCRRAGLRRHGSRRRNEKPSQNGGRWLALLQRPRHSPSIRQ